MSNSLISITDRFRNIMELVDNPDIPEEVLVEALDAIDEEFEAKCDNIVKFMRILDGDCKTIKEEEVRLSKRRKTLENKINRMKQYIEDNMKLTGKTKFKTPFNSFNISANPKSVEIINEDLIPDTYKIKETVCKIDKKAILADIKNGCTIDGININQTSSLKIR